MLLLCIVIYCLLVVLCGISSMAETSYFSLSPGQVHEMSRVGDRRDQLAAQIACRPRELLVTLLCFNILINILIQNVASAAFSNGDNLWIQVGIPFITTFCFSDLLPKIMALQHNVRLATLLAPSVSGSMRLLNPIIPWITQLASLVSRYLFFFLRSRQPVDGRQLLKALQKVSAQTLDPQEKKFMEGLIELQECKAHDIMWPRSEILYYNIEEPIDKLIKLIVSEECGKVPVCRGGLDQLLGVLYVKDLLGETQIESRSIESKLRKALFVPESMPAVRLLRQLDDAYESMALVVDEYGNVSGLLTREDLLETIIGEVVDRRNHKNRYTLTDNGTIVASGKWELEQVEALLGIELDNPYQVQTLGGWLTSLSGTIPDAGSRWVFDRYLFEVLAASPTHVRKVLIRQVDGGFSDRE